MGQTVKILNMYVIEDMMNNYQINSKQHWVFLVVFGFCALLGFSGVLVAEIFMPNNPGGNLGRLAMHRSMGTTSVVWALIALWSGYKLRVSRLTKDK